MSTSPYSLDLRIRVIKFLEAGNKQTSAAKIFGLDLSTVNAWYSRYRKEGTVEARKRPGAKHKVSRDVLIALIRKNPSPNMKEMAQQLGLSLSGLYHALHQLGFTRKKTPYPMWTQTKKNEVLSVS